MGGVLGAGTRRASTNAISTNGTTCTVILLLMNSAAASCQTAW